MDIFLKVLNGILMIIIPVGMAVFTYYLFYKNKRISKISKIYKDLIIGVLFTLIIVCCFLFGLKYENEIEYNIASRYSNVNSIPVIVTFIFGWIPGLISGLLGAITRIFIFGFVEADALKWAQVITLLFSTGFAILIKFLYFKDVRPKWFKAIVIGFLIESVHQLFVYLFLCLTYNVSYLTYLVLYQSDHICLICTSVTILLSLFFVALVDKDSVRVNLKEKRFSTKIRTSLLVLFLITTFSSSILISYSRFKVSTLNLENNMTQSMDGTCSLIKSDPDLYCNYDDYGRLNNDLLPLCQYNYFQENGTIMIVDAKNYKIASCNEFFFLTERENDFINKKFYVIDNETKRKRSFEDKDFYKENEIFEACLELKNGDKKVLVNFYFKYIRCQADRQPNSNNSNIEYLADFYVLTLIPYVKIYSPVAIDARLTIYLVSLIFIVVYYIVYYFIDKKLINSLDAINTSLDKITQGDLNEKVKSSNDYEFKNLSNGINSTVDTLKRLIDDANKRIDAELEYAKKIQQNSLPIIFPTTNSYDLFATMHTAKQVGGDFYDFFPVNSNQLFFLIADVSGKGIPAAMFMMRAKTLVKSLAQTNELTLDHIISGANDELNEDNKAGMFVTAWFGLLDIDTGELDYVNAGHNAPLIKRNGKYEYLKMEKNCVLGVLPYIQYKMEHVKLKSNDSIILYTDGVTEATSKDKELYGEERFLDLVNSIDYSSSSQTLDVIYNEVDKFQTGAEQADDITLLMITYKPSK